MLRIIYITGLLIANIANINKQVIKEKQKEQHLDDYLPCSSQYEDYSYYWYEYERLLRTILHNYDDLSPEYITFAKEIDFVVLDKKVTYIDFASDDGFVVLDKNTIYEYEKNIDLSKIHESDFAYDPYDKFILKNGRGYEKIFGKNYSDIISTDESIVDAPTQYDGQGMAGDGEIYDLDSYVSSRYPGYVLEQKSYLHNYTPSFQRNTSFYCEQGKKVVNGNEQNFYSNVWGSEGNCTINATFSLLSNLVETKDYSGVVRQYCPNFSSGLVYCNYFSQTLLEPEYQYYGNDNYSRQYEYDNSIYNMYWRINSNSQVYLDGLPIINNIPGLYAELRAQARSLSGYLPIGGLDFSYAKTMIQNTDVYYGYDIDCWMNATFPMVMQNVNYGIPSLVWVYNGETYHSHVMSVYGYARYYLQNSNSTDFLYFLMTDSGWGYHGLDPFYHDNDDVIKWYDPNNIGREHDVDITFMTIDKTSIGWPLC